MPVVLSAPMRCLNQQAFCDLDYEVMANAFQSQNHLGRLCDEIIYNNDLAARLRSKGLRVETEVPVIVSHRAFFKRYRLDLVVDNAAIYELKTTAGLTGEHEAQILNYLFLYSLPHGKLVNFRPPKVEARFVNATLSWEDRRRFKINTGRWQERHETDRHLFRIVADLVEDWGTCLEVGLYLEAVCFLLGGEEHLLQPVKLDRDGVNLGNQFLHLLTPETAFRMTAMMENRVDYEQNLKRLLDSSALRTIQWVNLERHQVEFVALTRWPEAKTGRKIEAEK